MWWIALILTWSSLTEQAHLDELRVSVVLDAAQTDDRVLFFYYDLSHGGLGRHYALYDFNTEETLLLEDGRIGFSSDAIVAQRGNFYAEANERVLEIGQDGTFLGQLRLATFDGWIEGLRIEAVEHEGDRVVALCQLPGEEDGYVLAHLDFEERHIDIEPISFPRSNRYIDYPEYEIIPFEGRYLRVEVHTAEVVLLDESLRKKKTLQPPRETWSVKDRMSGHQRVVEVFTKPFINTRVGVTGKVLFTEDRWGEPLDECIPGGFEIGFDRPIGTAREMIIGSTGDQRLLWDRVEQTVSLRRTEYAGIAVSATKAAGDRSESSPEPNTRTSPLPDR